MRLSKEFRLYWLLSWLLSVLFGEVFLSGIVAGNPAPFLYFGPFLVYYGILCFIFANIVTRAKFAHSLAVFFVSGYLLELLVFRNITSPLDVPGIIFFGLLYVLLFGLPWLAAGKLAGRPGRQ